MKLSLTSLVAGVASVAAFSIPHAPRGFGFDLQPRQNGSCENTPTSRQCWGEHSIDTNYYRVVPETGNTVEKWLSIEQGPCAPDGYNRTCMTINGTMPGPTIIADWGDNLILHVTNNLPDNGTAIHWHGLHQFSSVVHDGVPGITQCAIAPGTSMTYRFRVTQYGSTWYHSHFSLQYGEGIFGGMIFNGPATADYDEDLGMLFLQDWGHVETFTLWEIAKQGGPPRLNNGLINGTNTFNCSSLAEPDPRCTDAGRKFETVFEAGKKYRIRLVNVATDGVFQFSIDGHSLQVIANDLVPIVPYTTDSVQLTEGQRYDVIVEANADPGGDYWIRAGWVSTCMMNDNPGDMTGILRYDNSSTADPTSTSTVTPSEHCLDEPLASLVPHLAIEVTNAPNITLEQLNFEFTNQFRWTINTSSLLIDWGNPTMRQIFNGDSLFPTEYNVVAVEPAGDEDEWAVLVIQDESGLGINHPIHLHGHDFWVLAQTTGVFNGTTDGWNLGNAPRRDVATLPGNGYLAMAFLLDNPGVWLVHCHIAWHASQGLSLEFVESQSRINVTDEDREHFMEVCEAWDAWAPSAPWPQEDSGI